jgi:hypothetical protein
MNKDTLESFIKKYYLDKIIESVRWSVKNQVLTVVASTTNQILNATVEMKNFTEYQTTDFGIHDTEKLLKLIQILDGNIIIAPQKTIVEINDTVEERITSININDNNTMIKYVTADLTVIPKSGRISPSALPEFNVEIVVNSDFIDKYFAMKSALMDTSAVTFKNNDMNYVEMIFGYNGRGLNTTNVKFTPTVNAGKHSLGKTLHFDVTHLKNILAANKKCDETVLKISDAGLAQIVFTEGDITATYYLVAINGN